MHEEQEKREKLDKDVERLRETVQALRGLLKSQGWDMISKVAEEQIRMREQKILISAPTEVKDIIEDFNLRAERRGIKLFLNLPQVILENAEEEIKNELDAMDNEADD